eukprot:SAG31_NODE_2136_length_6360_cov_5.316882_2_plen_115_part_00
MFAGVSSTILYEVHEIGGIEASNLWNNIFRYILIFGYVTANLWIFVPPWMQHRRGASQLVNFLQSPQTHVNGLFENEPTESEPAKSTLPPTIAEGSRYVAYGNKPLSSLRHHTR